MDDFSKYTPSVQIAIIVCSTVGLLGFFYIFFKAVSNNFGKNK